jgi:hypothetical protein
VERTGTDGEGPEEAAHDLELSINRVATLVGEETTGWKRC